MRNEISKNNPNYLSKHRYLELKHFCLQYPEWKEEYKRLSEHCIFKNTNEWDDPVGDTASRMADLLTKMRLVEDTAKNVDNILGKYIFEAVTQDRSYTWMRMNRSVPCGKNLYYLYIRSFFKSLSRR